MTTGRIKQGCMSDNLCEGDRFGNQENNAFHLGLRFRAAGLMFVTSSGPTTLLFSLVRTSRGDVFKSFSSSYSLCLGSALIANILSSGSWHGPDLCRIRRHILAERCVDFVLPQNFFVVHLHRFFIMRPVASSSSSFVLRKASSFSLFSSVVAFSSISYRSASLFALSLTLFFHVIFFSFTSASGTL